MYYKLEKGNPTYNILDVVWDKMQKYNLKAAALVEILGFSQFGISREGVAGGISCILSETKPEGWKTVGKPHQNLIYPKNNNTEVLSKIKNLPIMSTDTYNRTIDFKSEFKDLTHYKSFGSKKVNDLYLIDISNNCEYTPTIDMIEITYTEYKKLSETEK